MRGIGLVLTVLASALVVALLPGTGRAAAGEMPGPTILVGDPNFDGTINSIDALWILWLVSSNLAVLPAPEVTTAADVNEDGDIDSIDAGLILQLHAGLIESFGPDFRATAAGG